MSSPVKYVTSTPSGSIVNGNVALGINSIDYGPSSITGWYPGINPPEGKYVIYETNVSGIPNIYIPNNTTELIAFVVSKGGTAANETAALQWIAGQSNLFIISYDYPNIVTNGLILLLDAKSVESYPTTGSIWGDLSGFNNSGSLINGPTFNSNGWINFDGSDDYANFPFNGRSSTVNTVEMLFRWRSNPSGRMFIGFTTYDIWTNGNALGFNTGAGDVYGIPSARVSTLNLIGTSSTNWRYYTFVFANQVVNNKIYINSIQETLSQQSGTTNLTASRSFSSTFRLSGWNNDTSYPIPGDFASVKIYNRELSQTEILQNYYQGPIVTDGLVFAVDAGNIVSYESGSLSTYSLTGSFTGSLDNGTSFSNINGGTFVFDGVDDFINVPINAAFNTPSVTFEVWANLQSINDRHIIYVNWQGNSLEVNSDRSVVMFNFNSAGQQGAQTAGGVIEWDTWNHFVGTYDSGSQTLNTYVNGILLATRANTLATIYSVYVHKISGTNFGGEVKGNISIVRHYNKALSAQEVAQNFTAQQNRFI